MPNKVKIGIKILTFIEMAPSSDLKCRSIAPVQEAQVMPLTMKVDSLIKVLGVSSPL